MSKDKEVNECSICLCDLDEKENYYKTPCEHCFHISCMTKWLAKSNFCPLCKSKVPANTKIFPNYIGYNRNNDDWQDQITGTIISTNDRINGQLLGRRTVQTTRMYALRSLLNVQNVQNNGRLLSRGTRYGEMERDAGIPQPQPQTQSQQPNNMIIFLGKHVSLDFYNNRLHKVETFLQSLELSRSLDDDNVSTSLDQIISSLRRLIYNRTILEDCTETERAGINLLRYISVGSEQNLSRLTTLLGNYADLMRGDTSTNVVETNNEFLDFGDEPNIQEPDPIDSTVDTLRYMTTINTALNPLQHGSTTTLPPNGNQITTQSNMYTEVEPIYLNSVLRDTLNELTQSNFRQWMITREMLIRDRDERISSHEESAVNTSYDTNSILRPHYNPVSPILNVQGRDVNSSINNDQQPGIRVTSGGMWGRI